VHVLATRAERRARALQRRAGGGSMHGDIRLGRLRGVELRADWSSVLVALLFFVSIATHFFATRPGWSLVLSVLLAALATLGLLGSIALVELAHAAMAQRLREPVSSITFFLLGGVATLPREGRTPKREILLACVRPLSALLLGIVLIATAGLVQIPMAKLWADPAGTFAWLDPVPAVLAWVGVANLAIALWSVVPALPLDGGRVVHAMLWAVDGDHRSATRYAARIGQVIALVVIAIGVASAFRLGPLTLAGGIWAAFLGWFLLTAASSHHRSAVIDVRLEGLSARHLMRPVTVTIDPDVSIAEAVSERFAGTSARALPVVTRGTCVGLLRFEDLRRVPSREWDQRPVRDAMAPLDALPRITPQTDLAEALHAMTRGSITTFPVLDEGDVVGILELADIVRWLDLPEAEPAAAAAA
jgi:Zn-dependent protease/CBS domain-containing protein